MSDIELGPGKRARAAYSFDEIAIVPSRRTRDLEEVSISWQIDAYKFELPFIAAPMDSVVSPETAIAIGKAGGLGVLNLEGIWSRYEDAEKQLAQMAKLASKWGNFNTIMMAIVIWIGGCIMGYYLPRNAVVPFYTLAIVVGFVMGGIQSVSRSTYSKLMPETPDTTSYFSFFDVTEKVAIVIGMVSFGFINEITGSQGNSVLALTIFFIIGLILLYRTSKIKGYAVV